MQNKLINYIKRVPYLRATAFFIIRSIKPKWFYFISPTTKPISNRYGLERGKPIDRPFIEDFLQENSKLIHGKCLELLNNNYTLQYGTGVTSSDILDIDTTNTKATIRGDLRDLSGKINDNTYDCIILTQVLQFIDDIDAALSECKRILKPGGHLLITVPAMSRIDCVAGVEGDFWRFTKASLSYILQKTFRVISINSLGNAKIGMGFWIGLSQQDIPKRYYRVQDENFPVLITAVAQK
jgi:SAM-dependent methyltransferase